MQYKGFYIKIKPETVQRADKCGKRINCNGFIIKIFDNPDENIIIDMFTAAVGYELLNDSLTEAEQLAKDYINMEEKELRRLIDEYDRYVE